MAGRPTVMTKEVLQKLEAAFSISCTDKEACAYAGISPATLYNYQNENPEYLERKEELRYKANIKARQTIYNALGSVGTATWWAERRMKDEFAPKTQVEHSGRVDGDIRNVPGPELETIRNKYEEDLRAAIARSVLGVPAVTQKTPLVVGSGAPSEGPTITAPKP